MEPHGVPGLSDGEQGLPDLGVACRVELLADFEALEESLQAGLRSFARGEIASESEPVGRDGIVDLPAQASVDTQGVPKQGFRCDEQALLQEDAGQIRHGRRDDAVSYLYAPLHAGGNLVPLARSELRDGTDHNGDGDRNDVVLVRHDLQTGRTTNFRIVVTVWRLLSRPASGGILAFPSSEFSQGVDLNNDGDMFDAPFYLLR